MTDDALERLQAELRRYREREEEVARILRVRAPDTDGLTTPGAINAVLNSRDLSRQREEENALFLRELTTLARDDRNLQVVFDKLVRKIHGVTK